ncbi:NAD(P)-binding domain-containing protein [Arthrobacter sp. MSA 4-2]|uniref:NAD(P)-binding domain-containing protein n=1 Tax=Arthrobacter sp. MSA 4-2 TaxID=2794349 RepID=UPI0018E77C69|nr:NAD(P)-binding domain-containing protein [Arthrobacter sp. MSA 4-2]MBJ2120232.1 NAD(P)-binding domain-containing protein [Arthrobacter sp. MSA 4-2]
MKIAVLGTGNVGTALADGLLDAGRDVVLGAARRAQCPGTGAFNLMSSLNTLSVNIKVVV